MEDVGLVCMAGFFAVVVLVVIIFVMNRAASSRERERRAKSEQAMFEGFYNKAKEEFEDKKREDRKKYYRELLIQSYAAGTISVEQFNERMKSLKEILEGRSTSARPSECPVCGAPVGAGERCEYCGLHFS
jgi:uncharacterized membrane protein